MTSPREHPRDQEESEFTAKLRELLEADAAVVAAAFVDHEGECVDYCSSVDPYECKVLAAHMQVVIGQVGRSLAKLHMGELAEIHLHASAREIVARRVDAEYLLVVVRVEGENDEVMLAALDRAVDELRATAGLAVPSWDSDPGNFVVEVRSSVGWDFAPETVVDRGNRAKVDAVFGRWTEPGGLTGVPLVCFRVHMEDGRESTLVYDPSHARWRRW